MSHNNNPSTEGWSHDRVDLLSRLWTEGLVAAEIAERLGGVSRSAVIGKAHRLGLSGKGSGRPPRPVTDRPSAKPRPTPRPSVAKPRPSRGPLHLVPEGPGLAQDLASLGSHDPKRPDFSFCGRPAMGRYCPAHEARATTAGAASRLEIDPVVKRALAGLL